MTPTQKSKAINDKAILRLEKFAKTNWGVTDIDLKNLDARAISKTFKEMNKVYKDFPSLKGYVSEIKGKNMKAFAGCRPTDKDLSHCIINFSEDWYSDVKKITKGYNDDLSMFGSPAGTNFAHTGVHELGHAITAQIIKKNTAPSDFINDWSNHLTASKIVNKALKNTKNSYFIKMSNKELKESISYYSSTSNSETISEAFSDWFANGNKAHIPSKEIINIIKGII